jgi:CubicO group peptidase (beta-lactamase class C family)
MRFARSALSLASFAASIATLATPSNAPAESGFADRAALEAFVDGVIEANRYNAHLAGVTLSIVKDGKIVLLKGYGLAGVDPERPVDPERSLFRIGLDRADAARSAGATLARRSRERSSS